MSQTLIVFDDAIFLVPIVCPVYPEGGWFEFPKSSPHSAELLYQMIVKYPLDIVSFLEN